ncbi:MAG: glycosyltransferase family 4 protein [Deltaproteobacteria bacterium]|nr:glycosyltransferase family 4 protein [Deltaproteobacteria bacterium]
MRIAYVSADRGVPVVGSQGSAVHVSSMVAALVERGQDLTVFTARPPADASASACPVVDLTGDPLLDELRRTAAKRSREAGEETTRAWEVYSLLLNQALLEKLEADAQGFDLVYERHSLWSFAGLQYARRRGVPLFLEVNAPLAAQQADYRRLELDDTADAVAGMVFPGADRVLVTCPALIDYAQSFGASRRQTRVVPCGVNEDLFAWEDRDMSRAKGEFVIGFVGSLKPWHGVDRLLKAFGRLAADDPAYRLLVVGDGPLRGEIEDFAARHSLADRIEMTGAVEHGEVPALLRRMDVGVAPYPEIEDFYFSPLKVWEYAAAGLPIAASNIGQLGDLFPHHEAALLHSPGRTSKLVRNIARLRSDPELAERLARRARQVARRHSWSRIAGRVLNLAEKSVERHSRAG